VSVDFADVLLWSAHATLADVHAELLSWHEEVHLKGRWGGNSRCTCSLEKVHLLYMCLCCRLTLNSITLQIETAIEGKSVIYFLMVHIVFPRPKITPKMVIFPMGFRVINRPCILHGLVTLFLWVYYTILGWTDLPSQTHGHFTSGRSSSVQWSRWLVFVIKLPCQRLYILCHIYRIIRINF